jgi:hypothetical protein
MTPVPMTPLLAELVGNDRANDPVGPRVLLQRFALTPEGRQALVPPFVLVAERKGGAACATAPNLDEAMRLAKRRGGCGRIVRGGFTGYWGSIPEGRP